MHSFDIDIKNISKIEGHTHMYVKVNDNKVTECKLKISENQRFFKKAIEGMDYNLVPNKVSRICGTCSVAHAFTATEAIEKALGIEITSQTWKLRRLLMNAGHIRDHAMHLYFFCLPDVFGVESIFDFKGDLHKWVHYGLDVKDAGTYLSTIIGGRAVHPPYTVVGGFNKYPTKEAMTEAIKKLEEVRPKVLDIVEVFYNDKKDFSRKANYVAIVNSDYNYMEGNIKTAKGTEIPESEFRKHLEEVVLPYSNSNAFVWESKDYMVGALARMNLNKDNLHSKTKEDCEQYLKEFPSDNTFNNNLAQAIETLHGIDLSIDILKDLIENLDYNEKPRKKLKIEPGVGVGVLEAPRGTLYYKLGVDGSGKIVDPELIIPTQQNIKHLEKDIAQYVEDLLKKGVSKKIISMEVEEMIRAYDLCMSCATHFLKIDWDEKNNENSI